MHIDLDTFLVAVYTTVDEVYTSFCAPHKPPRPGAAPSMTDSEVITLAVLSQWELRNSIDSMRKYAKSHWHKYFNTILTQSAFNKRILDLAGVMCHMVPIIAEVLQKWLSLHPTYSIIDGVAVPIIKCFRGNNKKVLAENADFGIGGSDKKIYFGFKIVSITNSDGLITGFAVGSASTSELWLTECIFRFRENPNAALPTPENMEKILGKSKSKAQRVGIKRPINVSGIGKTSDNPVIGDLLFKAKKWNEHWARTYGVNILTRDIYRDLKETRKKFKKWISKLRQPIETTFNWVESELGLHYCNARSFQGFLARMGAKLIGYNIAVGVNHARGAGRFEITELNPMKLASSGK
jgi:hypothetical protein